MRLAPLLLAAAAPLLARAAQLPLGLALERTADETTLHTFKHPAYPAHTLRFTSPPGDLCERQSRSWSGYLDVDVDALHAHEHGEPLPLKRRDNATLEHFYFWAFESRSEQAAADPTVLWLNGGPGCSSFTGLLMELGPCNAAPFNTSKGPHTDFNDFAWNNNATMLFLDQPVGVGFSYASWADKSRKDPAPGRIYDAEAAARDASAFLQLWGMHAKELFKNDGVTEFHIAGESYAGRWIPLIAAQLLRDNEEAVAHPENGIEPLPLASVLIGNGITSPKHQFPAYVEYSCANKSGYGTFFSEEKCADMQAQIPPCLALVNKCNTPMHDSRFDTLACKSALTYCEAALSDPWTDTGMSAYDWSHMGDYEQEAWVAAFLNDPKTHKALGIDKRGAGDKHDGVFIGCSDAVYKHFASTGDGAKDTTWAIKEILEKGTRVLTYSGKRDFICNHLGNEAWTLDLEWSGAEEFRKQPLAPWLGAEDKEAGVFRSYGNLTFAIVDASGHFVPLDQPANALVMTNKWLHAGGLA